MRAIATHTGLPGATGRPAISSRATAGRGQSQVRYALTASGSSSPDRAGSKTESTWGHCRTGQQSARRFRPPQRGDLANIGGLPGESFSGRSSRTASSGRVETKCNLMRTEVGLPRAAQAGSSCGSGSRRAPLNGRAALFMATLGKRAIEPLMYWGQSDGQSELVREAGDRADTGKESTQDHLRNRRSRVRILSGALSEGGRFRLAVGGSEALVMSA